MLAFRGLLRPRNLALVLAPACVLAGLALALAGRVAPSVSVGALALAIAPAPLAGPELVGRMRGRADLAGALVVATVTLSLLLVLTAHRGAGDVASAAALAYGVAAMVAGAIPTVRDAVLMPLRWLGWVALVLVLAASAATSGERVDAASASVALALLLAGAAIAGGVAALTGRDVRAAIGGAGLRDPVIALGLAGASGGPAATAVPLAYGVFCLGLAAYAAVRR